jgi:hypothetical protein
VFGEAWEGGDIAGDYWKRLSDEFC